MTNSDRRKRNFGGRPGREPEAGERVHLGIRVTPEMKRRLEQVAASSGRSQSQEAEFRLERSYDRNDLLTEVLTLTYGERLAGILMLLAQAMRVGAAVKANPRPISQLTYDYDWTADPRAFDGAVQAAATVFLALHPANKRLPKGHDISSRVAAHIVRAVADPQRAARLGQELAKTIQTIRLLLGPIATRLAGAADTRSNKDALPNTTLHAKQLAISGAATAVLNLINQSPRTPSRQELAEVLQRELLPENKTAIQEEPKS